MLMLIWKENKIVGYTFKKKTKMNEKLQAFKLILWLVVGAWEMLGSVWLRMHSNQ